MSEFHIEHLPVTELKPNPRNARRHSQKQISQIAGSIREFGFNSIVVVDEDAGKLRRARVREHVDGEIAEVAVVALVKDENHKWVETRKA